MSVNDPDQEYRVKALKREEDERKLRGLGFKKDKNLPSLKKDLGKDLEIMTYLDPRSGELVFSLAWWIKYDFRSEITQEAINAKLDEAIKDMKKYIDGVGRI